MFPKTRFRPILPKPFNWFGVNNAFSFRELCDCKVCKERRMHQKKSEVYRRGNWTVSEDLKIKQHVAVYGTQNWNKIAETMQGRNIKSCRLRWFNQLDPTVNKKAFTDEEEEKLLAAHEQFGNKWTKIAALFNGRTDNAVKNQWHILMRRKLKKQSNAKTRKRRTPKELTAANDITEAEKNTDFDTRLNQKIAYNFFPGCESDESTEIKNYIWKIPNEETTNLKEGYCSSCMPMQFSGHHHPFSTFPANSFTPHVFISQPSSSSFPSSSLSSTKAEETMATTPPRFIDFLGVGCS